MPPKSPSKGKKGKLSKAEKERLKKEEQDRKAKEEEDARLKAEQEERERLEKERLEREERERIEAAESQRYTAEIEELNSMLEGNSNALTSLREHRQGKTKWSRYMRCDGSPDPTVSAEINTYINLWKENESRNTLKDVFAESKLTLALIDELEEYLSGGEGAHLTEEEDALAYHDTVIEIQDLLISKLDAATFDLLKGATYNTDSESGNLQLVEGNDSMVVMVWGNLTKNPRFKSFEFEESKLTFELPKQLALSDIAVRFIQTKFDHWSHRCRTFSLKKKKKIEVVEEKSEESVAEERKEETTDEKKEDGDNEDDKVTNEEATEDTEEIKADEEATAEPSDTQEKVEPPEGESKKAEERAADLEDKNQEEDEDDEDDDDDEEYEFEDEDTVDLRAYQVLGGVLNFDLLALPPQPRQVKGWIMTQVTSSELQRVPYPTVEATKLNQTLSGTIAMGQTLDPKALANAAAATEALGSPPLGVKFRLADNVLYSEEPQLMYWSQQGKHWRLDGFTDINFDEAEKMISFKTINFGQLACVQDKHINMPFQAWELRPLAPNHTKLTIIAAILEVEIEIKDELCCFHLTADSEAKPDLDNIMNKWMSPAELIKRMITAGVNLFPEEDSKKYVSITEKNESTEVTVYQQMALTASTFAYSWSKWNSEITSEKIIIQGTEKLDTTEINEDDWSLLLMKQDRCFKLKMKEYDEDLSEVYADDGTQFHADLYHMVLELSSETGRECRNTDFKFIDTVYQILAATKIITYS